ncbi:2-oxo-4-hydroxy-4-carboxy-5-ureidoimidazoline decarboxylase [Paenibacillus xylanexedens]|uniref:2-oxo-4-hydroxy-4-carboxy-5-ureidoimidazoline decarboxylase n=1 Tax=Paenibacillus xylanexedens TaxID=528191 RepID=UPI0011AA7073|nr:2-oxo-4-hydroxy-4-carboxy-5-ureidoimidazoline decarboxylase [Paenibacillus xylanexedens]
MDDLIHLVNGWSDQQFIKEFGSLFEESAWIAERSAGLRPFGSWEEMMQVMTKQVLDSENEDKLELLRKHPDLGARISMSTSSVQEQAGAGLDSLTPAHYNELKQLNEGYTRQFGFPFILAVKGHTKESILDSMRQRLQRSEQEEFVTALNEVFKIATIRLQQWMTKRAT